MNTVISRLREAKAHLGAARIQRAPSDDAIIASHADAAEEQITAALREIEAASAKADRSEA